MKTVIEKRIRKFRNILAKEKLDAFMVLVEENRRYLSGFTGEDGKCDESAGALFITKESALLATDSRYDIQAQTEAVLFEVLCYREGLAKAMPSILHRINAKRIGFESKRLSVSQYHKINDQLQSQGVDAELIETEDMIENLRAVKSKAEITEIQKALAIAESAFTDFIQTLRPGATERNTAWELEKRLRESGADGLSFPTIVASGPNSALPHAIPGDRKLKKGEPILFDWGVKLNGYCSDISRTLFLGTPDSRFKKVFDTVLGAQQKAIKAIKPGASTKKIDGIARSFIEDNGFKGKFGHSLGHGAGLAIHEYPRVSPLYDNPLEKGMVFTVEPGIYIAGWGGVRLENMVAVHKEGAVVLNTSNPKNYLIKL